MCEFTAIKHIQIKFNSIIRKIGLECRPYPVSTCKVSDIQNLPYFDNTRRENWKTTHELLFTCGSYWLSFSNFRNQWPDTMGTVSIQVHKPVPWILESNMSQEIMEHSFCMLKKKVFTLYGTKDLLSYSSEPIIWLHAEPDKSCLYPHTLFLYNPL